MLVDQSEKQKQRHREQGRKRTSVEAKDTTTIAVYLGLAGKESNKRQQH